MKKWMSLLLALLLVLGMSSMAAAGTVNPLGEVANGEYVNDFFGLRVKLPDNWNFFSDEEVAKLMGYDARYADRDARASLLDSRPAVCGMLASDGGNAKAVFMVEDLRTNSRLSEQEYYEITKDMMSNQLASLGATGVTQQQRTFLVEGKAHVGASLSGYVSGIQWQLTYILLKMDRYIGAFTILTPSQTEIDLLLSRSGITSEDGVVQAQSDVWTLIGGIVGSNWDKDFPMIEVQPGLWVSASLPVKEGDEYKFHLNGNWAVNIGQGGQDGDNFVVNTTGDCIFSLNLNDSSVTCELRSASTYGVIGSICGTCWDTDFPMAEVETDVWRSMPLALKAKDEFKVRMNGSWEYTNYGLDGVMNGQNVVVAQDGVYVVTLDLKAGTLTYTDANSVQPVAETPAADAWSVIGTICGTYWDTDFPMREVRPGVWESDELDLKAGDEFKVRLNGSWATNYGITNGVCLQDGGNIVIEKDGRYVITLDLNSFPPTLTW